MSRRIAIILTFLTISTLFSNVHAQISSATSPTTVATVQPSQLINCNQASGLEATDSIICGNWYVIAASPADSFKTISCPAVKIEARYNSTIIVANVSLSNTLHSSLMNRSLTAVATTNTGNYMYGYNFTFQSLTGQTTAVTLKLLSVSNGFRLVCGYSNYTDTSSSFGFVLKNTTNFNETLLQQLDTASQFSNFANVLELIPQIDCRANSGAATLPMAFAGWLLINTLLNYLRN